MKNRISDAQIAAAKRIVAQRANRHFTGDDNIRLAYEWLDAQTVTQEPVQRARPIKHVVEAWAGCYVSQAEVEAAAFLHPNIKGAYPRFNISMRLIEPLASRLDAYGPLFFESPRTRNLAECNLK